jgi:hypothetical protein
VSRLTPDAPSGGRRHLLLGLLESAAAFVLVAILTMLLLRTFPALPERIQSQGATVVLLLSVTSSLLIGRLHENRGQSGLARGVYIGTVLWPTVAIAVMLGRFVIMFIGWGIHGE